MKLIASEIPGCFVIDLQAFHDARGSFVKTFRATSFRELGLESTFTESFYSTSNEGVLRGMHFQLPPVDGAKLVYVLQGAILDVATDLRRGSPAYGKSVSFELEASTATAVYIPRGVAHGFLTTKGPATVVYSVSSEYVPQLDAGVHWDSLGFDWPISAPLLSARDTGFPALRDFDSPFRYSPTEVDA